LDRNRVLHYVPNTLTVLTLVAGGMALALVPASLETVNLPNIAYRPLTYFRVRSDKRPRRGYSRQWGLAAELKGFVDCLHY
jgi:hypothetical protein